MARVLMIDDDSTTLETFGHLLRLAGFDFASASTGRDGIQIATEFEPHVVIIDLQLPDIAGTCVLSQVRRHTLRPACVLLTGFLDYRVEFEAIGLGACACVAKPIFGDDVVEMVDRALAARPTTPVICASDLAELNLIQAKPHASMRVSEKVVRFIDSSVDTRTLGGFGRASGISASGFRNWCRTADLEPRRVLLFARGLRAAVRQRDSSLGPNNLLNIVDARTLRKFIARCGGADDRLPVGVEGFLERQQFIADQEFIKAVRAALPRTMAAPGGDRR